MSLERISLIIPAFNEANRIGGVIEPALDSPFINDIIVVNDGSTDNTREVTSNYDVIVMDHETNLGKGDAMNSGVMIAKDLGATTLAFLDADLYGLNSEHIANLVEPIVSGQAIMTIGILERSQLQKSILRKWGALSGQRALRPSLWDQLNVQERHGFRVEAALNASTRHNNQHHKINRIELRNVTHTGKREKEPTLKKAGIAYLRTYGAALITYIKAEARNSTR